jgi:hypothetical protein
MTVVKERSEGTYIWHEQPSAQSVFTLPAFSVFFTVLLTLH